MSFKAKAKLFSKILVGIGTIEDDELMELISTGNQDAFMMMYNKYKTPLYNFLLNFTKRDEAVASELLQETFLKAHQKSAQFSKGGKLTAWLWAIARNSAIDYYKRKDASNYQSYLTDKEGEEVSVEQLSVNLTDAEELLLKKLQKDQVHHCLDKLKDSQKEVVTMQMFSDLSMAEIAKATEGSVSSVKSMLTRARQSLFKCLKEFFHE